MLLIASNSCSFHLMMRSSHTFCPARLTSPLWGPFWSKQNAGKGTQRLWITAPNDCKLFHHWYVAPLKSALTS